MPFLLSPAVQSADVLDPKVQDVVHVHDLAPSLFIFYFSTVLEVHMDGHGIHNLSSQLDSIGGVDPLEHFRLKLERFKLVHLLKKGEKGEQLECKVGHLGPICATI